MASKGGIIGGIISLVIGGVVYNMSQADVAKNFSKDTGMSQEEAQQYVEKVNQDELVPFDKLGADIVSGGQDIVSTASKIDCANYSYKWETESLSCEQGKSQLRSIGNSEMALGKAYIKLSSKSASTEDIKSVIILIDKVNANLKYEVVNQMLDKATIDEMRKTNSYNRALLQTALDSK